MRPSKISPYPYHRPAPSPIPTLPRQIYKRTDGTLIIVTGASRTGKTSWVAREVQDVKRLLVWDSAEEWHLKHRCRRVSSVLELAELVKQFDAPRRLAFVMPATAANFAAFCRLAWIFIRAAPGTLVVEELADVTSPGKAPIFWGEIIRKGLRYGPTIYALTQRPSESDKTMIGNASILHCHQMAREDDVKYMARELRVDPKLVDGLLPFAWIERDRRNKLIRTGILRRNR